MSTHEAKATWGCSAWPVLQRGYRHLHIHHVLGLNVNAKDGMTARRLLWAGGTKPRSHLTPVAKGRMSMRGTGAASHRSTLQNAWETPMSSHLADRFAIDQTKADALIEKHGKAALAHYLQGSTVDAREKALTLDYVRYFVSKGSDVNAKTDDGQTPLHHARDAFVVRFLILKGADVHAQDNNGNTPLHRAAERGNADIVKRLVGKGADLKAKNKQGETPPDIAKKTGTRRWSRISQTCLP